MPAVSVARPGLFACLALCACSETPIDAITGADLSAAGADGVTSPSGEAGLETLDCNERIDTAAEGIVTIETTESGQCLAQGPPTMVADSPAFEVVLSGCTAALAQRWRLIEAGLGSFELRNLAVGNNLDIQFAATTDGTPAVLFEPHQLYNQRFLFGPRGDASLSISPRHAMLKCLQQVSSGVQIWGCSGSEPAQGFFLNLCR